MTAARRDLIDRVSSGASGLRQVISAWISSCSIARATSGCAIVVGDFSTRPQAEACRYRRRDVVAWECRIIRAKAGGRTCVPVNVLQHIDGNAGSASDFRPDYSALPGDNVASPISARLRLQIS